MKSSLVFAFAFALVVTYLVAVNRGFDLHVSVFWLSILLLCAVPIYQLSKRDVLTRSWERTILIEIFLMTLAFRLTWILAFSSGLRDVDPHYDYYATALVMKYGSLGSLEFPMLEKTRSYMEWPMLHILTVTVSNTTGINLLELVKYFPLIYGPFSLPLFYLFARTTYGDARTGLLASYAMSALYQYVDWDSKFARDSLATGIFWLVLYVSVKAGISKNRRFSILAMIGVVSLAFCHSLTILMLILFGLTTLATVWLSGTRWVRYLDAGPGRLKHKLEYLGKLVVLLVAVIATAQWFWFGDWMAKMFRNLAIDLTIPHQLGIYAFRVMSPRVAISLYGNAVFLLVAGGIFLYHLRRHRCANAFSDFALEIWGLLVVGMCLLIVNLQTLASYIEVTRLQKFGWPFILVVTAHGALNFRRKKVYLVIFVVFVLLQVFTIPPHTYTRSIGPEYDYGRVRGYYLTEEYAAVDWFNSSARVVGDLAVFELLGGLKQVPVDDVGSFLEDDQVRLPAGCLLFYRMEDSQNVLTKIPIQTTEVVTIRPETLDIVANRYYDNAQVILYGFF